MDLLNKLADNVNFTFNVHLSEDGSYGSLRRVRKLHGGCEVLFFAITEELHV